MTTTTLLPLLLIIVVAMVSDGQSTTTGSCGDYCQPSACLVNSTIPTNPYELVMAARANAPLVTDNTTTSSNDSTCVEGVTSAQAYNGTKEVVMEVALPDGSTKINLTAAEYEFVRGPRFEFFRCQNTPGLTDGSRCRCCIYLVTCLVLPEGGNCSFYNQAANDDDYPLCRSPTRIASNWTYEGSLLSSATAPTTTTSPGTNTTTASAVLATTTSICNDSLLYPQLNRIPSISDWFMITEPDYQRALGGLGFKSAKRLTVTSPAFAQCRNYVVKERRPSCSIEMCNHRTAAELYYTTQVGSSTSGSSSSLYVPHYMSLLAILLSSIIMMTVM
eukprot:GFYU01028623.1.p1 GENE.GFYU01028623.1~~GFYU01028623.1.p1  ORF type:complete len:332 (-),score=-51.23 GFYU01028623.1:32-1027(-)